jgi:hypothetical protein
MGAFPGATLPGKPRTANGTFPQRGPVPARFPPWRAGTSMSVAGRSL